VTRVPAKESESPDREGGKGAKACVLGSTHCPTTQVVKCPRPGRLALGTRGPAFRPPNHQDAFRSRGGREEEASSHEPRKVNAILLKNTCRQKGEDLASSSDGIKQCRSRGDGKKVKAQPKDLRGVGTVNRYSSCRRWRGEPTNRKPDSPRLRKRTRKETIQKRRDRNTKAG